MRAGEPSLRGSSREQVLHRQRGWRISVALVVCFLVASSALHVVFQDFGWWFAVAGVVGAVLAAAAVARAVSPRRWAPTLVASLALGAVLTLLFAHGTAFLFVVPTPDSLATFALLAQEGGASIAGQSVPAEATLGVVFILCLGSGALAVVADLLAVSWRRPALAGLPLAAIVGIPTAVGFRLADVFVIVLTAVCWFVLLRAGQPRAQTSRALGIGALAVVAALLFPLVLPQAEEVQPGAGGFGGYLASVNPVLALGSELRRGVPRTILTYSTQSGGPEYLRLVSLQNFLADTWAPDPTVIDRDNVPSKVGPAPGLLSDTATESATTWVDVLNLGSPWLPVPYPATMVSGLSGNWFWDAKDLTFTSPDRAARGEEYRVESAHVQPTPAQLDVANSVVPEDSSGSPGKYLELPADLPAIIGETAREVTSTATSDYGRAVTLQEYFRDGAFLYSETAPLDNGYDGNGMTAIAQFLGAKSGYCVHFASAMAVMARTLGIPSRVAVGFLPGEKQDDTVQGRTLYRVTTQDVHSWPELFFEGIGWTRFEPTPGRGFVPTYADEATPGVPVTPNTGTTPSPSPKPTAAPTRSTAPLDPESAEANSTTPEMPVGWLWAALAVVGIALLLLIPAAVRVGQRVIRLRRLARGHPAATTGWKELLQRADDLGLEISATATPREAAAVIAMAAQLDDSGEAALASVLDLVERQSFAGEWPVAGRSVGEAAQDARLGVIWPERVNGILDRLRSASSWRARVAAVIAPRSIWSRLRASVED